MERMIRTLAIEYIRLQRLAEKMPVDSTHAMAFRHSLRRLRVELDAHDVSFLDLTDQNYDPGMALEIMDTLGEGDEFRIAEMRQPIILRKGRLLAAGEVILQAILKELPLPATPTHTVPFWHAALSVKRNQRRGSRRRKQNHLTPGAHA